MSYLFNALGTVLLLPLPGKTLSLSDPILAQAIAILILLGVDLSVNKTLAGNFVASHFGASPVRGSFTCLSPYNGRGICNSLTQLLTLYAKYMLNKSLQSNLYSFTFDGASYKGFIQSISKSTQAKYPGVLFYTITFVGERS